MIYLTIYFGIGLAIVTYNLCSFGSAFRVAKSLGRRPTLKETSLIVLGYFIAMIGWAFILLAGLYQYVILKSSDRRQHKGV